MPLAAFVAITLAAHLDQPIRPSRLAPTVPVLALDWPDWQLHRAPGSCVAKIALGHGAHLLLGHDGRRDVSFFWLVDPALALRVDDRREARLRIGTNAEQIVPAAVGTVSERDATPMLSLYSEHLAGRLRQVAESGSFTLAFGNRPAVTHRVRGAREGITRLLACAESARAALPEVERLPRR
jgi:hypothetical protein